MKKRAPFQRWKTVVRSSLFILLPFYSFAQPVNDLCSAPTSLTSLPTCVTTTGTLFNATATASVPTACGNAGSADVWYSFTAQSANPTITYAATGASLTALGNSRVQLFRLPSGTCPTGFTSISCNNVGNGGSFTAASLTINTTYYIRVTTNTNTGTIVAGSSALWGFTICVRDGAPTNNGCGATTTLTSSTAPTPVTGTVYAATNDGASTACGTSIYDVWYSFTATSPNPTIALNSIGTGFTSPALQLFTTCGSASLGCGTTSLAATGLTVGTVYRIRVFSTGGTAPTARANAGFAITVTDPIPVNDDCSNATTLVSGLTPTNTNGTLYGSSYSAFTAVCGGTNRDVWYSFVAQSINPTITISNFTNRSIQLLTGACGSLTAAQCTNTASLIGSNLTIGATYYVRIYSNSNAVNNFTINITDPAPANNACSGSISLTSSTGCNNVRGYVYGATNDGVTSACGGTSTYDMWYHFVAQTTNPTITLSSIGSNFTNASLELYSGACGSLVSRSCGTNSITASGLTMGTTYRIRVYSDGGTAPTAVANTGFDICVQDIATNNDLPINATALTVGVSCVNTTGTLKNFTASIPADGVPAGCGNVNAVDAWYSFVAQTALPVITLSSIGSNISGGVGGGLRVQLLRGTPGAFTQVACATGSFNANTLNGGGGLVIGTTYYIRITTLNNSAGTTGVNWFYNLCITEPALAPAPRFGNSYVNLSKRNSGGVVEPGDTLEIRMTINQTAGNNYRLRYLDNVPTNTQMLTTSNDSIRVITNEGLTYSHFTLGAGDDAATYIASPGPGEYNIRLNLGFGNGMPSPGPSLDNTETDLTGAQQMHSTARPVGGGRMLFATSFRVVVTGSPGDTITLGSGKFMYRSSNTGTDQSLNTIPYKILISNPMSLCANATGVNSAQEFGGTFGAGTTLNRVGALAFPITGYTYVQLSTTQSVGDGQYAIVKNSSPREGTNRFAMRKPNCTGLVPSQDSCINRMFDGHWFLDGDHTGTNNSVGNLPPAPGVDGGYMLMVNADYVASETYRQNITGLCPNTYYEFSAWIRNICPNCGVDSVNNQTWRPGVNPNLTFLLDDIDRYSTGEVDTLGGWMKKGFVFITGPAQTSATFSIRNNGQGGGGNDWVMDDISVATCLPNMSYSPSLNPNVCTGNALAINDTVRSYFNNYSHYQWQRSTDNGANWSNVGAAGATTPLLNVNGLYEYITSYTVPTANTNVADSGNLYRVIVATTNTNLSSPSCQVTDGISIINLSVMDCGPVLTTDLLAFSGKLLASKAQLSWTTTKEDGPVSFSVEKSFDGRNFNIIASVNGYNNGAVTNRYSYTDPELVSNKVWYRIVMISNNKRKISSVIPFKKDMLDYDFGNVVNPFSSSLHFDIMVSSNANLVIELIDMNGKLVRKEKQLAYTGINSLMLANTDRIAAGVYTLRVTNNDKVLIKRVLKTN